MPLIALTNSKGRDASVVGESVRVPTRVMWVDAEDRRAGSAKILKGTIDRDTDALLTRFRSLEGISRALIDADPEVDIEAAGRLLRETSRVYFNADRQVVFSVIQHEIVRNPDGSERLRRPKKLTLPNVTAEQPLRWSGKLISKQEVYKKFVMVSKLQLKHVNGLTFDFLFDIAKELEQKNSMLLVGAGPKSNQPLIFRRGAVPYRGFLEGRTRGNDYCLLLHLSNIELKAPEPQTSEEGKPA